MVPVSAEEAVSTGGGVGGGSLTSIKQVTMFEKLPAKRFLYGSLLGVNSSFIQVSALKNDENGCWVDCCCIQTVRTAAESSIYVNSHFSSQSIITTMITTWIFISQLCPLWWWVLLTLLPSSDPLLTYSYTKIYMTHWNNSCNLLNLTLLIFKSEFLRFGFTNINFLSWNYW